MLNRIISFSIKNKLLVGLMTLGLLVWGTISVTRLPIDAVPDITNNQVQIISVTPSLGAEDVERLITFPVELGVANIPGLQEVRSFSRFGLSLVTVVFHDDVDIYWARQQVTEKLKKVQEDIPQGIGFPELAPVTTGLSEIYQYTVAPQKGYEGKFSLADLRTAQDWIVRRQLLGTSGVADVSSMGGHVKQYEIAIHPAQLAAVGVTVSDIFKAIHQNNANAGGAYIEKNSEVYFIRTDGLLRSIEDIENVVIKRTASGAPILVKNVATVQYGKAIRYGALIKNGKEVSGGVVMMLKGENSKQVVESVKEKMTQIQKALPKGMLIEPFLDRTKLVNEAIGTVTKNLVEGALIVLFVLVFMLGNMRAGLLVASVIPLSMLFAVVMMNAFGVSGNLMSLGAIDFGMIVDGAVIIVETVLHHITSQKHLKSKLTGTEMDDVVSHSTHKMMKSAAFGQMVILIVYLPLLTLVGIEGKMFKPMAQTVAFALLGALLLSLTYVPVVSSIFLRKNGAKQYALSVRVVSWLQRIYQPAILWVLARKKAVMIGAVSLFALSVGVFMNMGGEFIPTLDEGDFACETRVMLGSSLNHTIDVSRKASDILLKQFPEVQQVVAKIGTGEIPTDPMPLEAGDLMIILKHKTEWVSAHTREDLANKMTEALSVIPDAAFGVQQPIAMRFNELMTGAKQDVVVKVYGENLDTLARYAKQLSEHMAKIKGVADMYVEQLSGSPQVIAKINRERLAQFGLSEDDINEAIQTSFAGAKAGVVFEGERRFDIAIRLPEESRKEVSEIQQLLVHTTDGRSIPLSFLAEVNVEEAPNQIQRDDTQRRVIIGFNVREGDVETIVGDIKKQIDKHVQLPPGYFITYGGQFQNLQHAKVRLAVAVPVALLLIFLLLFFAFDSIKQSLLVFSAIPLAAIGGVVALLLRGMPFSISAGVGFIALFGIAVLNGIVLIAKFNQLKEEGEEDVVRRILEGVQERLRPIAMTALVASLGFFPMAFSNSSGAEVQKPLATVVIGGLVTATLLTLFVLPVLYFYSETWQRRSSKNGAKRVLLFLVFFGLLFSAPASAQVYTLRQALSDAQKYNLDIKVAKEEVNIAEKILPSAWDMGRLNVNFQKGKINSPVMDDAFQLSQSVPFPTTLLRQYEWQKSQLRTAKEQLELEQKLIYTKVKWSYANWAFFQEQRQIFQEQDSLSKEILKAVRLRFSVGESAVFEKNATEMLAMQLQSNMEQSEAQLQNARKSLFQLLQKTDTALLAESLHTWSSDLFQKFYLENVPEVRVSYQKALQAKENLKLEKSKFFPELTFGMNNQTINPLAGQVDYGKRYLVYEVGLSIPIWVWAQQARVQSAKANVLRNELQWQSQRSLHQSTFEQLKNSYEKSQSILTRYRQELLPKAKETALYARKAFTQGAIDYLQYLQAVKSDIDIQQQYLTHVLNNNHIVSQLEYYFNTVQ